MGDELRLAQLLCSRLCHDLAGPAGAIGNGLEMLMDDPGDATTRELLADSGSHLNRRLAFYRTAFGLRGGRPDMTLDEARTLAAGYLAGGRTTLEWPADEAESSVAADVGRLLLCLVLIAAEALPRGGTVRIDLSGLTAGLVTCTAAGRGAAVSEPVVAALDPDQPVARLSAQTAHAGYASRLVSVLGADLRVEVPAAATVRITAQLGRPATTG